MLPLLTQVSTASRLWQTSFPTSRNRPSASDRTPALSTSADRLPCWTCPICTFSRTAEGTCELFPHSAPCRPRPPGSPLHRLSPCTWCNSDLSSVSAPCVTCCLH